jgi:hypothetical protein
MDSLEFTSCLFISEGYDVQYNDDRLQMIVREKEQPAQITVNYVMSSDEYLYFLEADGMKEHSKCGIFRAFGSSEIEHVVHRLLSAYTSAISDYLKAKQDILYRLEKEIKYI